MFDFEFSQEIEEGALNSINFKLPTSLKTKEQEIHADQQHVHVHVYIFFTQFLVLGKIHVK